MKKYFLIFPVFIALAACGPILTSPPRASDNAPLQVQEDAAYNLNPGDTLKVVVFGEDSLNGNYMVDRNGTITMPLIGPIQAAGLSKEEMRVSITDELVKGGFMQKPIVTVDTFAMQPFYIIGEVKNPGSYPWVPYLDVTKAVATAGGYSPRAVEGNVLIDRGQGAQKQRMNGTENTAILPGDSIIVRERIF